MIDEKKLIDKLKQSGMIADNEYGNAMVDMIDNQPKIGEWISFDKKLPNDKQLIWISVEYIGGITETIEGIFVDGKPCHMNRVSVESITKAWMPRYIPKPYHL